MAQYKQLRTVKMVKMEPMTSCSIMEDAELWVTKDTCISAPFVSSL